MRRFLKWFGISLGALIAVLALVVVFFDWNWVRGYANTHGSSAIGRAFAIEGDLDVKFDGWSWTPLVTAERVHLGNADWGKAPNLFEVEKVQFRIDLWELLKTRVVLPELTLDKPKIALEKPDDKRKNWDLSRATPAGAVVGATVPTDRNEFPVIGRLVINGGELKYDDGPQRLSLTSQISTATGSASDKDTRVRLQSRGTLQGQPFTVNLEGGSILSLRENDEPYPLSVDLRAGPTHFAAQGTMTDPIQMAGVDVKLDMEGRNLADIFDFTGVPLPPTNPYKISGRLTKDGDVWSFQKFAGRVGDSDLGGDVKIDASQKRNVVTAELVSKLLDIKDLAGFIGAGPAEDVPPEQRDRVLPDVPLNLERMRAADMNIRLRAERINGYGLPIDNMDTRFLLKDGFLTIDPLKFGVAEGTIAGVVKLDGRRDPAHLETELQLQQLSLKRFFEGTSFESLSSGRFGGRVQVVGDGKSMAQVMAGGNGRVTLVMTGGQISALLVHAADIDIAKATAALLGGDQPTALRCAVADFPMQGGVLTSDLFNIDTEASNIDGTAVINFANEGLDVRVMGYPKKPSPVVARTPITVTGTMKDPSVGIDPTGIAARGAAATALGIVLTPLAAIIPFIEIGIGKDSDCAAMVARADAPTAPGQPRPNEVRPPQLAEQPAPPPAAPQARPAPRAPIGGIKKP